MALILLVSPGGCQRNGRLSNRGGETRRSEGKKAGSTNTNTNTKLTFGGFKPVGQGKGLRFPGEKKSRFEKQGSSGKFGVRPRTTTTPPPIEDYYNYDDYSGDDYYYYGEEEPLPSGPTQEPPLPSGPTRRPGQPTTAPVRRPTGPPVHPALNQFLNLPLLTTQSPRNTRKNQRKSNKQKSGKASLRAHTSLNIVAQTKLFSSMDPHQEQFIPPPTLNAGVLPLAFESNLPLTNFPPFRSSSPK